MSRLTQRPVVRVCRTSGPEATFPLANFLPSLMACCLCSLSIAVMTKCWPSHVDFIWSELEAGNLLEDQLQPGFLVVVRH